MRAGRTKRRPRTIDSWDGKTVALGESRDLMLKVSESFSGTTIKIPLHVRRGIEEGPVVFITAALHGDEINGTGAVRALIQDASFQLKTGSVILVPVLNLPGFDRHSRYMPDRRDLNRCFPGSKKGSLASRLARTVFQEIVKRSDYGIDLHTASVRRTNVPTVRADMSRPQVRRLAEAFGCELILEGKGPKKSLRSEATTAGCPTIVMEGGEVWKVEPTIVECAVQGVKNVLIELGMIDGAPLVPRRQLTVKKTKWVRAERGGFLQFHVAPGEIVQKRQPLASNTSLLGREQNVLTAPFDGVILGMTTLPAVSPGEPVCNIGRMVKRTREVFEQSAASPDGGLHDRVLDDLAANVTVVEPSEPSDQAGEHGGDAEKAEESDDIGHRSQDDG
ncbi:MAG: succinylglutamate desuccinylase/aspartoacylase family protein [Thermoanaerobaculales bacterium]|jgi:predicted deacylase|nr:succinylglutamate desuccinylase/aspartoacylase family protein [Thermoanaerobaculales bacterium]